jgi:iron complex transport system substrate-binding protein
MRMSLIVLALAAAVAARAEAAVSVRDDDGRTVTLPQPAARIVSLAPHATELLFAAGAGARIVGTIRYSDYPEAAKRIPRIGDERMLDIERIAALRPDLLVVWRNGNPERQLEQLRRLGIPIFYSQPRHLPDIPDSIERLGQLAGTAPAAEAAAAAWRGRYDALARRHARQPTVRLFYQVWDKPLYTLNGEHIVSDAIRLCGGENIFADLKPAAPAVSIEAVLQADPEAIVGSAETGASGGVGIWKAYPNLTAVRRGNLLDVDGTLLNRPGPRMLDGAAQLCAGLEEVRAHRPPR